MCAAIRAVVAGVDRDSELACGAEMEELRELLEHVKQAEAAALLQHAQVVLCPPVFSCLCRAVAP
jgi:hypothetical protein